VLTPAQMKLFCRVEASQTEEDTLFVSFEKGARDYINDRARVVLSETTFLYYASCPQIDGRIYLPRFPVTSVTYCKVYNNAGTQTTLTAGTDYRAAIVGIIPRLDPIGVGSWPVVPPTPTRYDAIEVKYIAGYTDANRPGYLVDALYALVAFKYANRGDETRQGSVPQWINDLIDLGASGM